MSNPYTESTAIPPAAAPAAPPALRGRFVALLVIGLAVAAVGFLALRNAGSSTPGSNSTALAAVLVTPAQLDTLAASLKHPIFWLGPSRGSTYELSRGANGSVFVRYLPTGVAAGSSASYLTVATYSFAGAFAALEQVAKASGSHSVKLADGGLGVVSSGHLDSVHVAFPGLDYQVEVYAPAPSRALSFVEGGKLAAIGSIAAASSTPAHAVTAAGLLVFARALGHPVYWLGPRAGMTYELTQTSTGQVYVRYLPQGVQPGASAEYLTVATYPASGAFTAIHALAGQPHAVTFRLAGGGLGVQEAGALTSVHVAFPGSDYQIEVFDTDARALRNIISAGQLRVVG